MKAENSFLGHITGSLRAGLLSQLPSKTHMDGPLLSGGRDVALSLILEPPRAVVQFLPIPGTPVPSKPARTR